MVSAEELLERVWDETTNPFTSTVKTTMSRLRAKLGEPAGDRHRARGRLPHLMARLLRALSPRSWLRLPRRTARLRLTLLYTGMFLGLGTALIVAIYRALLTAASCHAHAAVVT